MNIPKQPFNQKFLKYLITVLIVIGSIWSASGSSYVQINNL